MKLMSVVIDKSPNNVFLSALLGTIAGIMYTMLFPIVLDVIKEDSDRLVYSNGGIYKLFDVEIIHPGFAALFIFLCLLILLCQILSKVLLFRTAMDVSSDIRVKMYRNILNAPLLSLEGVGFARLVASINTDITEIIHGGKLVPDLIVNGVTLAGVLSFLAYLNFDVFIYVTAALLCGVLSYQVLVLLSNRYVRKSRDKLDNLQESIHSLVYGIKELKLDKTKRDTFFNNNLLLNEKEFIQLDKTFQLYMTSAMSYGGMINFLVIGYVVFIFVNYHALSAEVLLSIVMVLLYITAPVANMLGAIPQLGISRNAIRKVEKIFHDLSDEKCEEAVSPLSHWDSVRFEKVCYQYSARGDETGFCVGPVNFELSKGEITFLVGGNGSGKSTLGKLIGLYFQPSEGNIHFGDHTVDRKSLNSCRQHISAIYTDYHLFEHFLFELEPSRVAQINQYLQALGLADKVKIDGNGFSTHHLSDGQRKRLALLYAFLDNKSLYIFDEWAADQDSNFKEVFYRHILADLKARGKAVLVISHDTNYFDVADKVILMKDGQQQVSHDGDCEKQPLSDTERTV